MAHVLYSSRHVFEQSFLKHWFKLPQYPSASNSSHMVAVDCSPVVESAEAATVQNKHCSDAYFVKLASLWRQDIRSCDWLGQLPAFILLNDCKAVALRSWARFMLTGSVLLMLPHYYFHNKCLGAASLWVWLRNPKQWMVDDTIKLFRACFMSLKKYTSKFAEKACSLFYMVSRYLHHTISTPGSASPNFRNSTLHHPILSELWSACELGVLLLH